MASGPSDTGNALSTAGALAGIGGLVAAPFTGGASMLPAMLGAGGAVGSLGGGFLNSQAAGANAAAANQAQLNKAIGSQNASASLSASNPIIDPRQGMSPLMMLSQLQMPSTTSMSSGKMGSNYLA